jgi:RNA 2',3'-cyclic 3'-phosphodiesterase
VAAPPDSARESRTFVAVALDARARAAAVAATRALRDAPGGDGVRWVREEALHVTLRFLGNVSPARIPELVRCVRGETAGLASFRVRPRAAEPFPNARRPRVVALALEPEAPLAALAAAVERGVVAAGFAPEPRRFRAHCTLGRLKPGARYPAVTVPVTPPGFTLDVTEAVLFRSDLGRDGAKYTRLESLPLAAPDALDSPPMGSDFQADKETA